MLGEHGEVALVDWGEARVSGEPSDGRPSQVIGTPIYMSPEQARGELADERSDTFCLGATLWHAALRRYPVWDDEPEQFWQKKRDGIIDPPTAEEQLRLPHRLLAIMRKAMHADPLGRYQTIRALSDDLTAFQAGQAVQAYRENTIERVSRWVHRHRLPVLAGSVVCVILSLGLWWMWGERVKEIASWGTPIVSENFTDDSWRGRWIEQKPDQFAVTDARLVSTSPREARLAFRQRLQAPIAIEYDGEMLPGSIPCDLSVWWNEGPTPFFTDDATDTTVSPPGYIIQAGAFTNQFCAIFRQENGERLAQAPFKLQTGKKYHIRVEIDETRISLKLDGVVIVEHSDLFPATSGYLSLYGYFPGKAFSNIRIWKKGVAEKVSVLAIGDAAFQDNKWEWAAAQYQRVADSKAGEPLGNQARYRQGLALLRAGHRDQAQRTWQQLSFGPELDFVAAQNLEVLQQAGNHQETARQMADLYERAPWVRSQLRSQWMRFIFELKNRQFNRLNTDAYLAVKDRCFPDDTSTNFHYGRTLLGLKRYQEAAQRFPKEPLVCGVALAEMGQDQALLKQFSDIPDLTDWALIRMGRYSEIQHTISTHEEASIYALGKSGHAQRGVIIWPKSALALIAAGRASEVLQQPHRFTDSHVSALLALGQWSQAVAYNPTDPDALMLAGKDTEAAVALKQPLPPLDLLLLRAAIAGDRAKVATYQLELASEPPSFQAIHRWFGNELLSPFISALAGDPEPWRLLREKGSAKPAGQADLRYVYGQRLWYATAYLRGEIDEARFLTQPTVSEAPALLLVLRGMQAEVRGDRAVALNSYRAFSALAPAARLLSNWQPNVVIERLVAWRLTELSK